jgi:tetratricopeptide (TPR) repeat protein
MFSGGSDVQAGVTGCLPAAAFLRALRRPGSFLQALEVPARQIPAGLDERAAMYRDRIQDRRALIVLDNAAGQHQVRSLIPGGPDHLVVPRPDPAGTALANRGVIRLRQGDYSAALQDLLDAQTILRGRMYEDEIGTDLGLLYLRLNRPEEALAHLTGSLAGCRDHGLRFAEGWALIGFAELHHANGDHAEALDSARAALTLAEDIGEHAIKIHAHNHLGRAETALGRPDTAAEHHRTAFDLTRRAGDVYQRAKALDGLAAVHRRRRREPELAAEKEKQALLIYRRIGVPEARSRPDSQLVEVAGREAHGDSLSSGQAD